MNSSLLVAVVDANILVPNVLRDVFVSLAFERVYAARWTEHIHEEWTRNVVKLRPDVQLAAMHKVRRLMDSNIRDSLVVGYEPLIETLSLPDPNDRHVLAAAIVAGAKFIVTNNVKDFPDAVLDLYGVQTRKPDAFLCDLWPDNAPEIIAALNRQRARLRSPALSSHEFLHALKRQGLSQFADALELYNAQL